VKMYRYSLEERVFIVKTYWITGSIKNCQRRFVEQFGGKHYQKKKVVGLERGPLSLVSTTEELLDKKSSGSCLEIREYGRRDPSR
jgi:hypothetical protein